MKVEVLGLYVLGLMAAGCTTIPDDAPQEFFDARAALDRADEDDVDDVLPQTIDRAEARFDEGVDLLKEASDGADTKPAAIAKAVEARDLAENALAVNSDVKAWDEDMQGYLAFKNRSTDEQVTVVTTSPAAQIPPGMVMPVAFFETAAAEPHARAGTVNGVVDLLDDNKDLSVQLVGHADHRGDAAFNKELAQRRAEAMAKELEAAGIPRDRIEIVSVGAEEADETSDPGALQLDRRVDVQIIDVAH